MTSTSMIDVSVCLVTWNNEIAIQNCLDSLLKYTIDVTYEVILVDNNSSDRTVEIVSKKYPFVRMYPQNRNLGFASANNIALRYASGRYVLFLNPDTELHSDVLAYFMDIMDNNPTIGIIGCRLVSKDGSIQLTCASAFPTAWNTLCEGLFLHRIARRLTWLSFFSSRSLDHWDHLTLREVETISGAFMFCRKSLLDKVGGFDSGYFMYGDDLDLCARIRAAGFKVLYDPAHIVTHYGGVSSLHQPSEFSRIWQFRSNYKFITKHSGVLEAKLYRLAVLAVSSFRIASFIVMYPFLSFLSFPAGKFILLNFSLLKEAIGAMRD